MLVATEFYYQNFYSLAERTRGAARQFRDGLESLNINRIPQTMEQFRNLVDRLMAQGRDGAAAGLVQMSELFKSLLDLRATTEDTTEAVDGLTRAERRAGVLSERAGLREQLWALQGRTEKLREAELATLSPSNRALQIRIWGLEDEAAAAEAAAAVNQEHKTLQLQLWELQGRTNKIREYELSQLDEANRAIQIKIWAMEDEAAAADLAARALDDAKNAAEALADSLTTDQFRSAFEFNRAVGLARNGYGTPSAPTPFGGAANTPTAPPSTGPTTAQADATALLHAIKRLTAKTADMLRKWDKDGLPLERTY